MIVNFLDFCADLAADTTLAGLIRTIYNAIRIGVPLILIVVGSVGMGKAIASQKEEDIKKAQHTLVKQAVAAVIVFLMFSIVKLVVKNTGGDTTCLDCILNNQNCTETAPAEQGKDNSTQSPAK